METLQRRGIWDYPLESLREAVINALIHRDYFQSSGDIQIRVYDDRVMISNPGGLPADMTVEELQREFHRSVLRNPLLAQVFYYANLIEKWGSGTWRMIKFCREQGLPEPEFRADPNWFLYYLCQRPLHRGTPAADGAERAAGQGSALCERAGQDRQC